MLSEVLKAYNLELPQLSPNAVARLAVFEWAMRAEGCEGRADVFVALHDANCQPKPREGTDRVKRALAFGSANFQLRKEFQDAFPARAVNNKWYSRWDQEWFYASVGANSPLRSTNAHILYRREGVVTTSEGLLHSRISLLRRVAAKMSMRDLAEEFITLRLSPLARSWPEGLFQASGRADLDMRTPEEAIAAADRVVGTPTPEEQNQRLALAFALNAAASTAADRRMERLAEEKEALRREVLEETEKRRRAEASAAEAKEALASETARLRAELQASKDAEARQAKENEELRQWARDLESFVVANLGEATQSLTERAGLRPLLQPLAQMSQEVGNSELVSVLSEASGTELNIALERATLQQIVLARAAATSSEIEFNRLKRKVTTLQEALNGSEDKSPQLEERLLEEQRVKAIAKEALRMEQHAQEVLVSSIKELQVEQVVLRAKVDKLRVAETTELSTITYDMTKAKAKHKEVADETMDTLRGVLEYFGTVWPSTSSATDKALGQKLKMIPATAKMMKGSGTHYGEFSGQVDRIRVLHHLEAIGVSITPMKGSMHVGFADEGLLQPPLDVALASEAFRATWKADCKAVVTTWINKARW
ncbi:hypothetical protein GUJ93_ZPchr0009g1420 [Zizania palustris]|uniref:Uncharacterized protein n=1 Tax=Zizania palustris TaxID=103762 RepID=A0A8J5VN53_ZIZPA|nr:hypothetical protein GUJ93_ZPchr0009g1420 [Zizania palustris]